MRLRLVSVLILLILVVSGCKSSSKKRGPAFDPELLKLSKEEVFNRGETMYDRERYARSRGYYAHVYENYPNDPLGRRSLLRIADTYFKQGDSVNLVEAQYKYRDFINRFPGSEFADYAMLQIANVSYKQMERPDRDQAKTHEAIQKYQEMLAAYPNSRLRPEAEKKLNEAMNRLARHEHLVGQFYIKRMRWDAAIKRLNSLIDDYSSYNRRDEAFYDLAVALEHAGRKGEARLYFERVIAEFPKSDFAARAKNRLEKLS